MNEIVMAINEAMNLQNSQMDVRCMHESYVNSRPNIRNSYHESVGLASIWVVCLF